jgi:hypothetical protein
MPKGEGHAHEGRWKDDFNKVGHFPVEEEGVRYLNFFYNYMRLKFHSSRLQ